MLTASLPSVCQVRYTHHLIERLASALLEHDPNLERTLLIVAGDHGEAFGEHGFVAHGTSLFPEETRVPLLLAGGPVGRALSSGALRVERRSADEAIGSMAVRGAHRLEDLPSTILELIGHGSGALTAPAEDAERAGLYGALAQLGVGGRSLLWASRHPAKAEARPMVQHSMFGSRKLGLVHTAKGVLRSTIFTYDGCGECRLLETNRIVLHAPAGSAAAADAAVENASGTADDGPPRRAPSPIDPALRQAVQLSAAATALHRRMRSAPPHAAAALSPLGRANALLRSWLAPDGAAFDGTRGLLRADRALRYSSGGDAETAGSCGCDSFGGHDVLERPRGRGPRGAARHTPV